MFVVVVYWYRCSSECLKKNKENIKKKEKKKKTRKTTFLRNFGAKTRCIIGNVKVVSLLSELL